MEKRSLSDKCIQEDKSLNALAETFRLQEAILNATGLAILSTTPEGLITSFNRSAENLLGYSSSDVIGKVTPLIFHDLNQVKQRAVEVSEELKEKIEPGFSVFIAKAYHQKTDHNEWTLIRKDGSHFLAIVSIVALRDGHENLTGFACTITDITEQQKIKDSKTGLETIAHKLQEQNRQLDEFAHIISHNLRAPVNNIKALINLLDGNSAITDYKLIYDKLKNVAKNLSETMNELMDTLKVKTNPAINLSEIRFKEILDKVVQSLEGELIVAQADVTFDFNQAPTLHYSKPYLESIFQNLLTNAIKYRSPNRKPLIHFQSSVVNDRIELRVIDNGQGIDMERFGDKLFGLHKTFHDHQEARGVGLFLIKTQIEAMGGSISVESEVDKGTTFITRFGN